MLTRHHISTRSAAFFIIALGLIAVGFLQGCHDLGSDPLSSLQQPGSIAVLAIHPDTAAIGDTIAIVGSGFGSSQGSSTVRIGGVVAGGIVVWTDTLVRVVVPQTAASGVVVISMNGVSSTARSFSLRGTSVQISFSRDILPIFNQKGCISCHGGSGGLFVGTVAQLLQGGNHGPVIVPGNAGASNIVKKLSPTPPFGDRMPLGGPYLPDALQQTIKDWINQGAKDN